MFAIGCWRAEQGSLVTGKFLLRGVSKGSLKEWDWDTTESCRAGVVKVLTGSWKLDPWTWEDSGGRSDSGTWDLVWSWRAGVAKVSWLGGKSMVKALCCCLNSTNGFRTEVDEVFAPSIWHCGVQISSWGPCCIAGVRNGSREGCGRVACTCTADSWTQALRWGVKISAQLGWSLVEKGWAFDTSFRPGVKRGLLLAIWKLDSGWPVGNSLAPKPTIGSFPGTKNKVTTLIYYALRTIILHMRWE